MITKLSLLLVLALAGIPAHVHIGQDNSGQIRVLEMKAPVYPAMAEAAHAFGAVVVSLEIDFRGIVVSSRPISGHPLLLAASRRAASSWRFEASVDQSQKRNLLLKFDFVSPGEAKRCSDADAYEVITPYYLRVYAQFSRPQETISEITNESEPGSCPVHHASLLKDKVEIEYGLIAFKKGYLSAEEKYFPYANTREFGGCIIETEIDPCAGKSIQTSPRFAEVLYCKKCRIAKAEWLKNHKKTRYSLTG